MTLQLKDYIIIIIGALLLYTGISMAHYRNKTIALENGEMVKEKQEIINKLNSIIKINKEKNVKLNSENIKLKSEMGILNIQQSSLKKELDVLEKQLPVKQITINNTNKRIQNDKEMCDAWAFLGFKCITSH